MIAHAYAIVAALPVAAGPSILVRALDIVTATKVTRVEHRYRHEGHARSNSFPLGFSLALFPSLPRRKPLALLTASFTTLSIRLSLPILTLVSLGAVG